MKIFGKSLLDYVWFARVFLVLIPAIGILRLLVADSRLSVTVMVWVGVVYYALRVHTSGFGSYKQLLPIVVLMMLAAQAVIVPSIVVAIFTGVDNIYSVPENAFGADGKTWSHAAAHLFVGSTIGSLVGWLIGCGLMFGAKKILPGPR